MNQPLKDAIELYDLHDRKFVNLVPWHTVHGIVVIDPDCVFLAYYTDSRDLLFSCDENQADTLFVSYYGGNIKKLSGIYNKTEFIAYERIRSPGKYQIHKTKEFLKQLTK